MIGALMGGADLCMGSRFKGGIKPGAMPWKNRYIGNPLLTGILNLLFHTGVERRPLRPARPHPGLLRSPEPDRRRHGVRQRDGDQGGADRRDRSSSGRPPYRRICATGRPTCAPGAMAGGTCAICSCSARRGCSPSRPRWRSPLAGRHPGDRRLALCVPAGGGDRASATIGWCWPAPWWGWAISPPSWPWPAICTAFAPAIAAPNGLDHAPWPLGDPGDDDRRRAGVRRSWV